MHVGVLGKGVVWLKWVLAMCRVAKSFKGCGRNLAQVAMCLGKGVSKSLRLGCSVCSLIIHELQLSSVSSTTLIFISTQTEQ